MSRRLFLAAGAALVTVSRARAQGVRLVLDGRVEQGSLVIAHAGGGSQVTVDGKPVRVSGDGVFAFGFAYDQTKGVDIAVVYADGLRETLTLTPDARSYDIQRINGLPQDYVTPPPDIVARIARESAAIVAARNTDSDADWFADGFDWPAAGPITGVYGSQRILNGTPESPHYGVDIAAGEGAPIHAPCDGIVTLTDEHYLNGGFTLLDHGQGVSTCYLHQSARLVTLGQRVRRGDVIGHVGHTGRATGPHLHWAMNWFQVKLDPSHTTRISAPPPLTR